MKTLFIKTTQTMDTKEFRRRGKEMVDYIADYLETVSDRRVTPNVEPGYLKDLLPDCAPEKSEDWDIIMNDFEKYIMPGVTHWQHSRFNAYFPSGNSYPSILADLLSDGMGCVGFSWVSIN
jgi:aromatic-L-amino-acid decarboxylase